MFCFCFFVDKDDRMNWNGEGVEEGGGAGWAWPGGGRAIRLTLRLRRDWRRTPVRRRRRSPRSSIDYRRRDVATAPAAFSFYLFYFFLLFLTRFVCLFVFVRVAVGPIKDRSKLGKTRYSITGTTLCPKEFRKKTQ